MICMKEDVDWQEKWKLDKDQDNRGEKSKLRIFE